MTRAALGDHLSEASRGQKSWSKDRDQRCTVGRPDTFACPVPAAAGTSQNEKRKGRRPRDRSPWLHIVSWTPATRGLRRHLDVCENPRTLRAAPRREATSVVESNPHACVALAEARKTNSCRGVTRTRRYSQEERVSELDTCPAEAMADHQAQLLRACVPLL